MLIVGETEMSKELSNASYLDSDNEVLSIYLEQINKIPMLSYEEEYELALKAMNGDKRAFDRIINANLRFVVSVAKKYRGQGLPLSDLINEGNIGLITALEKFEPEKGYHFISYAVWWIRQSIMKALSEKARAVRLPLNRTNELMQIQKVQSEILHENVEDPNDLELLSERTGLEKDLVKDLLSISQDMVNLDSSIKSDDDSSSTFSEFIEDPTAGPEAEVVDESLRTEVRSLLLTLSDKERTILSMRYGLDGQKPMSLKEIGLEFGLTKERIRQIEKRALEKLRDNSQGRALECYTVA